MIRSTILILCAVNGSSDLNPLIQAQSDETPAEPVVPHITSTQSNLPLEIGQLIDELTHCDVIFLGEQHDNDSGHLFQLQVIQGLADRGLNLVISTEQFERDVQGVVDDYLEGRITEEDFIAKSRPWPNYQQHYRPIVEFAREKNIPVAGRQYSPPSGFKCRGRKTD